MKEKAGKQKAHLLSGLRSLAPHDRKDPITYVITLGATSMRAATIHVALGLLLAAPTAAWSVRTVRGLVASQRSLLPSAVRCCATEGEGAPVAYTPNPNPNPTRRLALGLTPVALSTL